MRAIAPVTRNGNAAIQHAPRRSSALTFLKMEVKRSLKMIPIYAPPPRMSVAKAARKIITIPDEYCGSGPASEP